MGQPRRKTSAKKTERRGREAERASAAASADGVGPCRCRFRSAGGSAGGGRVTERASSLRAIPPFLPPPPTAIFSQVNLRVGYFQAQLNPQTSRRGKEEEEERGRCGERRRRRRRWVSELWFRLCTDATGETARCRRRPVLLDRVRGVIASLAKSLNS